MRANKKLKIVINKIEQKSEDEDVLQVTYILDGESKEKTHVIADADNLTDEEKIVFMKFFMIIERLLSSKNANKSSGI